MHVPTKKMHLLFLHRTFHAGYLQMTQSCMTAMSFTSFTTGESGMELTYSLEQFQVDL